MKTLLKNCHGQTSSKRVIALLFCGAAIVGAFTGVDSSIVITFATFAAGTQALTTKHFETNVDSNSTESVSRSAKR